MIIKGCSHTGRGLGAYLLKDKSDRVEEWGIRGDIPRDLKETLNDWRSDSLGTNCTKPLYHAQLNPDRTLSREEWDKVFDLYEKQMGFENQPRVIVFHEYKGRQHIHAVYSRMDENGHAITDSWNYAHHEKAAREIEKILGLEKTQGVFIDRKGNRPERTPSQAAIQQGKQLKLDLKQIKTKVTVPEVKQEAKIELDSGIQNEKHAAKSLTLAERIQKNQQERLNQREKQERGEAIQLDYGLGLNRQRY